MGAGLIRRSARLPLGRRKKSSQQVEAFELTEIGLDLVIFTSYLNFCRAAGDAVK
jgi:hypothetical protein